jgi:hypothetical protein
MGFFSFTKSFAFKKAENREGEKFFIARFYLAVKESGLYASRNKRITMGYPSDGGVSIVL